MECDECLLDSDEEGHSRKILQNLDSMRNEKKHCDLIIKVGEDEISVNSGVMAAESEFFDRMMVHDTVERQSRVVEMKDVKFQPVKKCVDFVYSGKISVSLNNCEELLYTASLMQINPIRTKIVKFLQNHLNPSSFFNIRKMAEKFDLEDLSQTCDNLALDKLCLLAKEKGFSQLEVEYVSFLMEKSQSAICEDLKMEILLQWIKADTENRSKHLLPIMHVLHLGKFSVNYGKSLVENEPLCGESVECMKMLHLAILGRLREEQIQNPNVIIVFDISSKCLQAYNPATKLWSRMHPLLEAFVKSKFTAVVLRGIIYVLMTNKGVMKLDLTRTNSAWESVANMLNSHGSFITATTLENCIYVAGNDSIERYNEGNDQWEILDSHGIVCNQCELVHVLDSIYCIGGATQSLCIDTVNKFSPISNTWTSMKLMQTTRATPAAIVYFGKIFVAGGFWGKDVNEVHYYDPKADDWKAVASMNQTRNDFQLCVIQDKLYAVGNRCDPVSIEVYDPILNCWEIIANNPDMKILAQATVSAYLLK